MANTGPDHDFRKLRLDTRPKPRHSHHAATDFPFAASFNADHVASSAFSSQELVGNRNNSRDDDEEELSRRRGSSVSFKNYATLDDGRQHSLDHPLPRSTYSRRRSPPSSTTDTDSRTCSSAPVETEESPYRINPFTGEPIRRRTRKSEIAPRLETIDSHDSQQPPSMTTESTASLLSYQLKSPPSPRSNNSYLLSSPAVSSPIMSPSMSSEPWPMMPQRNKTLSRTHSLRNSSRRSSRMSASSMSPASAFLSQWGRESVSSAAAPEPDDEGQPLGLEGEYVIGRQIGVGGFSTVKEVIAMTDDGRKTKRAVKIVRKSIANTPENENDKHQQTIEHEIGIWRYLQHDHIMKLHVAYDTDFATFCIMDLMQGGSLFDLVRQRRKSGTMGLPTDMAKKYAYQLASALRYLHEDVRLVHRDVKLENCLIQTSESDDPATAGNLRLCDFGLADFLVSDMSESVRSLDSTDSKDLNDRVGTLQYAAPEVLASSGSHLRPSTDIWAFGVCLYTILTGCLPFTHPLEPRIVELISTAKWNRESLKKAVPTIDFDDINDLIEGCLTIDPEERWTIGDVMNSPWFSDFQDTAADNAEDWQFLNRPDENGS